MAEIKTATSRGQKVEGEGGKRKGGKEPIPDDVNYREVKCQGQSTANSS